MDNFRLYKGYQDTGVSVRRDVRYLSMWRIHQGERISDIVNVTRAKDAALSWAFPNGGQAIQLARWKGDETGNGDAPSAFEG